MTTDPQRHVLVLAHEPGGGAGEIEQRLLQRGFAVDTHWITSDLKRPNDARPFPTTDGYDLLVIMGSTRSLTHKADIDSWVDDEINLLARSHASGLPLLGVCFGGQLLAEALGGSVENAPVTEIGWHHIEDGPGVINPVGSGPWMEWHHDRLHPPAEAEVLAVTEHATQLFRIGATVGTQFHPEVSVTHVAAWLSDTSDAYLDRLGVTRRGLLAEVATHEAASIRRCHHLVDWFIDEVMARAEAS